MGSGAGSERLAVRASSCGVALPGEWALVLLRSTRLHVATSVVPTQPTLDGSSAAHTAATVLPFDFWLPHWALELGSSSLCVCGWAAYYQALAMQLSGAPAARAALAGASSSQPGSNDARPSPRLHHAALHTCI